MESVTGSDNGKTVTVVYKTPFRDWKSMFASGTYILPAHYMEKQPGGWNTGLDKNPENFPSGGWFKVENYTPGQSLTLVRNDKYFGPKSNLDSVVFRFLPESTTQPAALQNNEVDLIYPQPQLDQVTQVKALPDVTSQINFGPTFEHFDFNFKNKHLGDLKVRQAIAKGINVEELVNRTVKQFSDQAAPLGNRIYMKTQPDQYQDHFTEYGKGDTAAATALLEEAGYTKGGDGIYAKGGDKLSLRISTTAGNQLRETQEELFQAQMKEIGVDIKIANADSTKFFSEWLPNGNFDIANFAWVGSPFSISGSQAAYITGSGSNYGAYSQQEGRRPVQAGHGRVRRRQGDRAGQPDRPADHGRHGHDPAVPEADLHRLAQHLRQHRRQQHPGRPLLERQPVGAEDRLEPHGVGDASRRGPVGDRRPASAHTSPK